MNPISTITFSSGFAPTACRRSADVASSPRPPSFFASKHQVLTRVWRVVRSDKPPYQPLHEQQSIAINIPGAVRPPQCLQQHNFHRNLPNGPQNSSGALSAHALNASEPTQNISFHATIHPSPPAEHPSLPIPRLQRAATWRRCRGQRRAAGSAAPEPSSAHSDLVLGFAVVEPGADDAARARCGRLVEPISVPVRLPGNSNWPIASTARPDVGPGHSCRSRRPRCVHGSPAIAPLEPPQSPTHQAEQFP